MTDSIAFGKEFPETRQATALQLAPGIAFGLTHVLSDVEQTWRTLGARGVESPGQSYDFIQLWTATLGIPRTDQFYLTATLNGRPLALLPLHRRKVRGVRILSWLPGPHVGCNAPLVDERSLAAMSSDERRALWQGLLAGIEGADAVYLKAIPQTMRAGIDLFAELGHSLDSDTLYRSEFASWDEANTTQRNKSRRKHDRQQGERLEALGAVDFETIGNGPKALDVLDTMFKQRAARFRTMGVSDPFARREIRRFYDETAWAGSRVPVKLHVLRLAGEIVAVRYNIVAGERLFCLISSMSDDLTIQVGSPGKQCLLRVMQTEFDAGTRMFDMGAGFTDEKRHWCNVHIPVRQHYLPITGRGALAIAAHRTWAILRQRIKSDERLLKWAKGLRGALLRLKGQPAIGD
ncbi:MAG: GNAT family N-acetyltransferase [Devosia sp.]